MTNKRPITPPASTQLLAELCELVAALDRRVPHLERTGETGIAHDAAMLRNRALTRIEALKREGSDQQRYDPDVVDAVMTDDGGR